MTSSYYKGDKARRNDKIMTQIREHCKANGISKEQLADMSGYHLDTVRGWLRGSSCPRYWALLDLVDALGMELTLGIKKDAVDSQLRVPKLQGRNQHKDGRLQVNHLD